MGRRFRRRLCARFGAGSSRRRIGGQQRKDHIVNDLDNTIAEENVGFNYFREMFGNIARANLEFVSRLETLGCGEHAVKHLQVCKADQFLKSDLTGRHVEQENVCDEFISKSFQDTRNLFKGFIDGSK